MMKLNLLVVIIIVFCCQDVLSAENITIQTKSGNLFENFVSDTVLLLDPDLKKIISDDISNVVKNSTFQLQPNSWRPKQDPRIRLTNIYNDINVNNLKQSFASLVQPVVEIACSPQRHDPLSEVRSICVKDMFKYPVINTIVIKYSYDSNRTIEQYITDLAGLNDSNRYPQMISTTASIMNSAFAKINNKSVIVGMNVTKHPLKFVSSDFAPKRKDCSGVPGECGPGRSCLFGLVMGRKFGFCEDDATANTTYKQLDKQFDRMNREQDNYQAERRQRDMQDKLDRIDRKLR